MVLIFWGVWGFCGIFGAFFLLFVLLTNQFYYYYYFQDLHVFGDHRMVGFAALVCACGSWCVWRRLVACVVFFVVSVFCLYFLIYSFLFLFCFCFVGCWGLGCLLSCFGGRFVLQ